jgi:hypothetical protein
MTDSLLRVQCPECLKWFDIPLVKHHIIDKDLKKYLVDIAKFPDKEIERLRRMLFVYICKECEKSKHEKPR